MAEGKKSIIVYADWISIFSGLNDDEAGRLIKHFFQYVNDQNPEPPDRLTKLLFEPIKQTLKRDLIKSHRKEYHWNWKNGISPENKIIRNGLEIKEWRREVFKRDNYTCQICFDFGGKLHAHHIMPFAEFPHLRFYISNGITLCKKCHKYLHSKKYKNGY
jgi:predicted restriction endonuclease